MFGSTVGIAARTRNWLGVTELHRDVREEIQRWTDVGLNEKEVAQRLFDLEYPPQNGASKDTEQTSSEQTASFENSVLFGQKHGECNRILDLATIGNYSAFVGELKESNVPGAKEMVGKFQDNPEDLEFFLETVCRYYLKGS